MNICSFVAMQHLNLSDISAYLQKTLLVDRFPVSEQGGIYRASDRPIRRLGLALDPSPQLADWVRSEQLDALWLHRPWRAELDQLPADVGILTHHLPFDEHLTMGQNPQLADLMGLINVAEFGYKRAPDDLGNPMPPRPIGMIGDALLRPFSDWVSFVEHAFTGFDRAEWGYDPMPTRVVVAGVMNSELIREAYERGASLYLTGEYRTGAQAAVEETGMAVIAIGHRRTEEWGLRTLKKLLRRQWRELEVIVATGSETAP